MNYFLKEHNAHSKFFDCVADPDKIVAADREHSGCVEDTGDKAWRVRDAAKSRDSLFSGAAAIPSCLPTSARKLDVRTGDRVATILAVQPCAGQSVG
jgi:hypothetical protein